MHLYFTDSMGNRTVVAKNVLGPAEAIEKIMEHKATRFIHGSGVCKIHAPRPDKFTFSDANGKPSGYSLE